MNKLILPAMAVTAVLALSPAFAGETTLHVKTKTTPAVTTTTATTSTTGTVAVETPASTLKGDPGVAVSTPEVTLEKTAEGATPEAKVVKEAVEPQHYTLKDGTNVLVDAGSVFIVAADNAKTPAPDGDHMTAEGKVLKVKGGLLITETPEATTTTTTSTEVTSPAVTTTTVTEEKTDAPKE